MRLPVDLESALMRNPQSF